jgi:hypothetical protein
MLQRSTQVGEFYVMGPPTIPLTGNDEAPVNFLVFGSTRTNCVYSK